MKFDPATGDFLPPEADQPTGEDPDAPEAYSGTTGALIATILFGLVLAGLAVLFGLSLIVGLQATFNPDGQAASDLETGAAGITAKALWAESSSTLLLLGIIPFAWVVFTRVRPRSGSLIYLRLQGTKHALRDLGRGVGLGLLLWLVVIVIGVVRIAFTDGWDALTEGNSTTQSPLIDAFARELTWPLAIFISFVAATSEELFFRGVMQRWMGWWGQAILFGLTHASYGTLDQIVFPFALGLVFGWLIKRGHSLYLVIAAHFVFNFVQFALLLSFG